MAHIHGIHMLPMTKMEFSWKKGKWPRKTSMTVSGMKGAKYSLHDWILSTMIWKRILKESQCILSFLSQPLISTGLRTPFWVGRGFFHYYIKWNTGGILAFHHINFRLVSFESLMLRRGLMLPENTVMLLWFLSVLKLWDLSSLTRD